MIEKLDIKNGGVEDLLNCIKKINEVVDAVNKLQEEAENNARIRAGHEHKIEELQVNQNTYWTDIAELKKELQTRAENVQPDAESRPVNVQDDPYAEQRRWIGKLCWVWDDDGDERAFSKLNEIIEDDDDRPFKCFSRWKHCEPVKPDDDIIYKGGDNE